MNRFYQVLLMLHFVGLAMGFAASFANMAMGRLIERAAPPEKSVLGQFPPIMSGIGRIGLLLLLVSGVIMTYVKFGGMGGMRWQFYAKLAAVLSLTVAVVYIYSLERRVGRGDTAAGTQIVMAGKVATSLALLSLIFAVLAFD